MPDDAPKADETTRSGGQMRGDLGWPPISYWLKIGVVLIGVVVVLLLVLELRPILLIVAASFVLALGVQPALAWFEHRGLSRAMALAIVMAAGGVVVGGFLVAVVPALVTQLADAVDALPVLFDDLQAGGGPIGEVLGRLDPGSLVADNESVAVATLGSVGAGVVNLVTVGILTPYFSYAFPDMKRFLLRLVQREDRPDVLHVLNQSVDRISGFVAGNLLVSLVAFVVSFAAFQVIGLDYAVALAAWVGFTDVIPVVGVVLGSVAVLGVAATHGLEAFVASLAFIVLYQQLENYLVVPKIMRHTVDLSPPAVIVAFLAGGALAGVAGALLALPVTAILKLVFVEFVIEPRMGQMRSRIATGPTPWERRRGPTGFGKSGD